MCKHLAKDNHSLDDDGPCIPYLATHKQSVDERDKRRHGSQTEMLTQQMQPILLPGSSA